MTKNENNIDQRLKQLNQHIDPPHLNTLEANVWQVIESRTISTTGNWSLFWRAVTLSLVLVTGGLIGANATVNDQTLVVFSNTPAYSVMALLND
ncbi:MAG: hypothetical protein L3J04_02475 [Robiginitomaculum sp.]|nr:hypothetical protein [Robiginitomaculum sp.]